MAEFALKPLDVAQTGFKQAKNNKSESDMIRNLQDTCRRVWKNDARNILSLTELSASLPNLFSEFNENGRMKKIHSVSETQKVFDASLSSSQSELTVKLSSLQTMPQKTRYVYPPNRGYCFRFVCLSVCLSVCPSVCPSETLCAAFCAANSS